MIVMQLGYVVERRWWRWRTGQLLYPALILYYYRRGFGMGPLSSTIQEPSKTNKSVDSCKSSHHTSNDSTSGC